MKALNITLTFNGEAAAAFNFYKSVFGGEFITFQKLKDAPNLQPLSAEDGEKILHVSLPVAGAVIAGMDIPPGRPKSEAGNNFFVSLDTSSEEETTGLFNKLSAGGMVMMPVAHQFWGAFFGMVVDKFGIQWMLSYVK